MAPERRPGHQPQPVSPKSAPDPLPQPHGVTGQDHGEPREEARDGERWLLGARARLWGGGAGEAAGGPRALRPSGGTLKVAPGETHGKQGPTPQGGPAVDRKSVV